MKINESKQDNTRVSKIPIQAFIKATPRQYYFKDLGGKPSKDTRTSIERNKDYWHPIKGAKDRFKSSMKNETNPLVGIEKTIMPAMAGSTLITAPSTLIGGLVGGELIDNATGRFGEWLEDKSGLPSELGKYLNPGAIYGGTKGYNISKNNLLSKFIKGDADLGWNPLNKNHWVFDKNARTSTNITMAALNRILPFLSNAEKTPARIAAYQIGKRTKGNPSVSLKDIRTNISTYTGAATPEGNNGNRNLLGFYLFQNDPLISKSPWFQKISKSFKPASKKGFSFGKRYSELYPGVENRRYQMDAVVKDSKPLKFNSIEELNDYANGIGKIQGKEGDMVIDMGNGYQTFRQPGSNFVGPIDDIGGHLIKIDYNNKGKLTQISQDLWKFNPADYSKKWSGVLKPDIIRTTKQAALMDKVGTPFILQQENPVYIGNNRIWQSLDKVPEIVRNRRQPLIQSGLLVMKQGGLMPNNKFKFKDSYLVKNSKMINKRDMRKKIIKSDRPTYSNNKIKKAQLGLKFVSFSPTEIPTNTQVSYKLPEIDVFSPYYFPSTESSNIEIPKKPSNEEIVQDITYDKPQQIIQEKPKNSNIKFNTSKDFISVMKPIYESVLQSKGLNKQYADYLVAQAALESGWGKSQSGKNNLSGIKVPVSQKGKGQGTVRKTREVINGKNIYINDEFRDFNSLEDFANYHVDLLNSKRYKAFTGDFISNVVKGGYATDPRYKNTLTKIYNQIKS